MAPGCQATPMKNTPGASSNAVSASEADRRMSRTTYLPLKFLAALYRKIFGHPCDPACRNRPLGLLAVDIDKIITLAKKVANRSKRPDQPGDSCKLIMLKCGARLRSHGTLNGFGISMAKADE